MTDEKGRDPDGLVNPRGRDRRPSPERGVRFVHLWVTDVLGQLKSFSIKTPSSKTPSRAGWASTAPDHGLQPDHGVGHDRHARRLKLRDPPLAARGAADGADVLRHPGPRRRLRGRPALDPPPRAPARRGHRLRRLQRRPRARVLLLPRLRARAGPRGPRRGRLLRPDDAGAGVDVRRHTVLALEQMGIHVEYTHHEVGPSQHESTCATRTRSRSPTTA